MFGKSKSKSNPGMVEVLSVHMTPEGGQEVRLQTVWEDPGAWGMVLVDIARHLSKAYAQRGLSEEETLARIRQFFDAEWSHPTDTPVQTS